MDRWPGRFHQSGLQFHRSGIDNNILEVDMKIGIEIQPILKNRSGIGWYTYNLLKELRDKDISMVGKAFNFGGRNDIGSIFSELCLDPDVCKWVPYSIYSRIWNYFPIPYNILFNTRTNIYHFFNYMVPPMIKGAVILNIYDMVVEKFPETMTKANYNRLRRNLLKSAKRADIIITISENSKREIIQYLDVRPEKIFIVEPGVDIGLYEDDKCLESDRERVTERYKLPQKYILYLGTLEPRKNIESLIKAFAEYKGKYNDRHIKLVLAGGKGWGYNSIFQLVQSLGLGKEVVFTGYVREEDKPIIYKMSSMFIFPSLYEGFGMPVIEAMAAGIPVISSNSSALPEVAGDAAILVEPNDIESICENINRLLSNEHLRFELITKGKKRAQLYTWEKAAEKMLGIYKHAEESKL